MEYEVQRQGPFDKRDNDPVHSIVTECLPLMMMMMMMMKYE
jgi:hypothetical protein